MIVQFHGRSGWRLPLRRNRRGRDVSLENVCQPKAPRRRELHLLGEATWPFRWRIGADTAFQIKLGPRPNAVKGKGDPAVRQPTRPTRYPAVRTDASPDELNTNSDLTIGADESMGPLPSSGRFGRFGGRPGMFGHQPHNRVRTKEPEKSRELRRSEKVGPVRLGDL